MDCMGHRKGYAGNRQRRLASQPLLEVADELTDALNWIHEHTPAKR
jgi:hypothetical protein